MTDTGGGSGKGKWPEMRSLGWPPEGVALKSAVDGAGAGADSIPPFELAPDPAGSGTLVAVAVPVPVPDLGSEPDHSVDIAAASAEPAAAGTDGAAAAVVESAADAPPARGGCAGAALVVDEIRALRRAVDALTVAIRGLGEAKGGYPAPVVHAGEPTRTVSDVQARQEIQEYFLRHLGQTVYPAQIADALNLPLLKVAELCETLAVRGQISRNLVA